MVQILASLPRIFRRAILLVVAACCLQSARGGSARGQEPNGLAAAAAIQEAFVKAIESAEKSVVAISRDKVRPSVANPHIERNPWGRDRMPDPSDPGWVPNEFGAGIIIDKSGLILTNYHLVRGGPVWAAGDGRPEQKAEQNIYVRLADRRGYDARIYAADPRSDLAVLKLYSPQQPIENLAPLKLGATIPPRKGQMVIALGNPYAIARDGSASATWGIISNLSRSAHIEEDRNDPEYHRKLTVHHLGDLLQIDTRLELGTSGGALLNLQGELIGMTTSLAAIVGYEKAGGFAVPFDDSIKRIIESLRQGKEVEYGFLGIGPAEILPSELMKPEWAAVVARIKQYSVARIESVVTDLPAYRGGLRVGDLVLRIGDKPIFNQNDLMREIGFAAPGSIVRIKIFRDGEEREVPVEVGKWPVIDEEGIVATRPLREPWRGIVYDYGTSRRRFASNPATLERSVGIRVIEVLPNTPAAARDIQPGDLITHVKNVPVTTPREFADAVQKLAGPVIVRVSKSTSAASVVVEIKP
jgi:serine protease Do